MVICKSADLYKSYYKNSQEIKAIADCNIEISAGEFVAICGAKNSGKTTLLKILGGLERPTSGMVYINHNNIALYSDDELAVMRQRDIGYLFQKDSLIYELNVNENIIMPALLSHKRYNEGYYKDLIHQLQLEDILSCHPKELNDYQLQCIMLARALINNPDIILVDEPSEDILLSLDKRIIDFLLNIVYQYHKTLIMVTNNKEISIFVDHVIQLENGKIIEDRRIS